MITLKILWGEDPQPPYDEPETYEFNTQAERDAFVFGAIECLGWQDFEVISNAPIH